MNKMHLDLGLHNGILQVLPPLWVFPKMTVMQLIKNGYVGNHREKFTPISILDAKYVHFIGALKAKLKQIKCVLQVIDRITWMEDIYNSRE